ncbi:transcription elongation factor SPT6 isoform X2 [Diabrotica virgifera virgifera]|uniref:Transcription elongation factor spt6 n=1 Tax=Diabrotica virgifera virgifera TaxID=50390 RepID=A0ABM5KNA6_DIAVI|nr:transcription elongation factor SPT6 isoform X2 [Diabrotica virgifera virgifera]
MADFIDSEAEESSEEEELDHRDRKKAQKAKVVDSSDEDDEDDDERLREELKDLIDDNPIEESDAESDASGREKRKKSDDEDLDDRLEDEDYDLLEENLGVKVERRKFKRLRRFEDEESEGEEEHDPEQDREQIAMDIFSDDDDERRSERSHRPAVEQETYGVGEEEEEGEYSDADDFIVDDDGRPIAEKKKKKKPIFTDAALQEAQETFGVDFDYDEFSKYDEDDYEDEEEEDDEYEEDDVEKRKRPKKTSKKKPTKKSIFEVYEPSELKRGFFTDLDNEIRNTDIPERMQLRDVPITAVPDDSTELDDEAEWIYRQAFCNRTVSNVDSHLSSEAREKLKKTHHAIGKIRKALDFIRNQQLEVPFIAFYRKEYVQPELNINDLWKVYKYDAKWCQLKTRKENLLKLFEKMRSYQTDHIMKDPDAPIPDNLRIMTESDIERLKNVQTAEELNDVHNHFILYYAADLPAMHAAWRVKERERRRQERKEARLKLIAESEEGAEIPEEPEEIDDDEPEAETLKYANRSGSYALCNKGGLGPLAKKFGLTPEEFAENLRDNYQRHEVDQEHIEPVEVAKEFVSPKFPTVEEVLQATKHMVALQIAREPLVRKCVREIFFERARLNVYPTKKGVKVIDEAHNCYSMKYVKNKPVRDLAGDQFLKLCLAEEENLLTITINDHIQGNTTNNYIDEVKQLYIKDEFSKHVQDWNALRMESVERALTKSVLPDLRSELKRTLLTEAKEFVLKACCRKLYNWIKIAPYAITFPDEDEDDWDTSKGVRTMGVAYVPEHTVSAFTCISAPDGDITDYLRLPNILKRKNSFRTEEKLMKEADLQALKNFIFLKKPHVIAVGGESREALMIADDIRGVISELIESDQFPQIRVEIIDNELAKVYANSIKGSTDFRDYPELLRQAISLARRMQDPLVEFSQLCNSDEEILSLRFHPLQEQVQKEELLEALCLEFVNRTNEVGVDINLAVQQIHKSSLVQFICGLGPRKGQALLKVLKQTNQRLENRTQLVTFCHMGPKVFINCSGFIKIDTNSLGDSTEAYVEILDGSRVHPETYEWARKMAVDALEYDDDEGANPAGALEEILEAPERLKDLDLDAFAEELERQGFGNKSITLYDIRAELNSRYKDLRQPFRSANPEELFDMLTKETPETFYIGKMVTSTVFGIARRKPKSDQLDQANPVRNDETGLWQCPFCLKNDFPELSDVWNHFDAGACPGQATGVKLRLDNGILGYIYIKNISDKPVANPEERVGIGQLIHCRIIKIDVEKFSVDCTSKSSDLADKNHEWRPQRDPHYDQEREDKDNRLEAEKKKEKQRMTYIKRVIVHPAFHNISYAEAEKCMVNMDQGEVIIRPSSKGADHLTITWKVTDGIYQHIDIKEQGKVNAFSLGKSLWIGNEEFEDLDEIIARHVTPMAAHARDLLYFRYYKDFQGGHKDKAEEYLKDEKKKNASKIHYVVSAAKNIPGKFLLSYLPRNKVRHEYVTVTPEGFRFRQQMFDSVSSLFKWFKEHFREPPPGGATPGSTPRMASSRTGYGSATPAYSMNNEAIQRVAQNLPSHVVQALSAATNQTPHYPHTPGYGGNYINTPYTPSGQTPYMTPYATPHTQQTPRYGHQTPSQHMASSAPQGLNNPFLHPGAVTPSQRTPIYRNHPAQSPVMLPTSPVPSPGSQSSYSSHLSHNQRSGSYAESLRFQPPESPRSSVSNRSFQTDRYGGDRYGKGGSHRYGGSSNEDRYGKGGGGNENTDWQKAAEAWARSRSTPRSDGRNTPRSVGQRTPRYDNDAERSRMKHLSKSPRSVRSTPRTNTSPHSMSLGDATPLYDESI